MTYLNPSSEALDILRLVEQFKIIMARISIYYRNINQDIPVDLQFPRNEEDRARLSQLRQSSIASALRQVRILIARGILNWKMPADGEFEDDDLIIIIQGLMAAALWPLITSRRLQRGWDIALQEISSPEIVSLVRNLRAKSNKLAPISLIQYTLMQQITQPEYFLGLYRLIEDISDIKNGALAHSALIGIDSYIKLQFDPLNINIKIKKGAIWGILLFVVPIIVSVLSSLLEVSQFFQNIFGGR